MGYGFFVETLERLFYEGNKREIDEDRPLIIYGIADNENIVETTIEDEAAIRMLAPRKLRPEKIDDWKKPILIDPTPIKPGAIFNEYSNEPVFGLVEKQQFVAGSQREKLSQWQSSPLLKHKLSDSTQSLIDNSGVGMILAYTEELKKDFFPVVEMIELIEDEQEIKEQLLELDKSAELFVVGSTFANESLDVSLHTQFKKNDAVGKIFDLGKSAEPFQGTLGLPNNGLIAGVSANLESLRSPSIVRVLLRQVATLLKNSPTWNKLGVDSAMIDMTGDLVAEAWHHADSIRSGLYLVDQRKSTESMAVIVVIEPRQPDSFLDELSKIMVLVDKSEDASISQARVREIQNWIENLDADSYETRKRATARLMLAGNAAEPFLKKAAKSGTLERRMRIQMLQRELRTNVEQAASTLLNQEIQIWHQIQPSYSLRKNTGRIGNYELHEILIDPGKQLDDASQSRYRSEMKSIFGLGWSKVKLVRVNDRFVLMIGSSESLLQTTIDNVAGDKDPIRTELTQNDRGGADKDQIEINVSIPRMINLINFDKPDEQVAVGGDDISSLGLAVDQQTWELTFHFPIEELRTFVQSWLFR